MTTKNRINLTYFHNCIIVCNLNGSNKKFYVVKVIQNT